VSGGIGLYRLICRAGWRCRHGRTRRLSRWYHNILCYLWEDIGYLYRQFLFAWRNALSTRKGCLPSGYIPCRQRAARRKGWDWLGGTRRGIAANRFFWPPPMTGFSCQGAGRRLEAKNRPWGRYLKLYAGSGLTRTIPGARPAGGLWPSSRAILPGCRQGSNRAAHHRI